MVRPSDGIRKKAVPKAEKIPPVLLLAPSFPSEKEAVISPLLKKFAKQENPESAGHGFSAGEGGVSRRTGADDLIIIEPDLTVDNIVSAGLSPVAGKSGRGLKWFGAGSWWSIFWRFLRRAKGIFGMFRLNPVLDHGALDLAVKTDVNVMLTPEPDRGAIKGGVKRSIWFGLITGFAAVLALVILFSTVFARITLEIKPRVENVEIENVAVAFDISVSKVLGVEKVIPAERLEFTRKAAQDFETTGREVIEEKAKGRVRIYNRFSSSPQGLVPNTRFLTPGGALYRLTQSVIVPGAKIEQGKIVPQFIEADLAADKAGEGYNLSGEATLKIPGFQGSPKYDGFYAVAPSGFSGGFKGEARVVSQEDLTKAEEQVTKKVFDELKQEIARKVPPDFKLVDSLSEIEITKIDAPRENTRRDKLSVEASAVGKVFIFREKDVVGLLRELILAGDASRELLEETANVEYKVKSLDFGKGKAGVLLGGNIKTSAVVPQEEIAELVRGKRSGTINEILKARGEIAAFEIYFFPPWLFKAPNVADKIRFKIGTE